jgi:hypothetical protein
MLDNMQAAFLMFNQLRQDNGLEEHATSRLSVTNRFRLLEIQQQPETISDNQISTEGIVKFL